MASLSFEVNAEQVEVISKIQDLDENSEVYMSNRLDGSIDYTTVIITVVPSIITAVTAVITSIVNSKKHRKIKINGTEITNLSADDMIKVIREASND